MDLCSEIVNEMNKLEFNRVAIDTITSDIRFIQALPESEHMQKTLLTMVFFNVLMKSSVIVPPVRVRLALNSGTTSFSWLEDIKLVILPWLKFNEETYFPTSAH